MSKYAYTWKKTADHYRQFAGPIGNRKAYVSEYKKHSIGVVAEIYEDMDNAWVCTHVNHCRTITEAKLWCESILGEA